ncbi:MAG: KH domain-containing protein [Acidobacteria bacterium]|nr:MAG: KH domain-containing protein [Acidobacteriota bacterium]
MKELVELIAKSLVDRPDEVKVSVHEFDDEDRTLYELSVAPDDLGKVIGRHGRTARSVRTILASAGVKLDRRIDFEIVE